MKRTDLRTHGPIYFLPLLWLVLASSACAQIIGGGGMIGGGGGIRDVTAIKSGTYLYVRTDWTAEYDLVQKVDLWETATAFNNSPVRFVSVGTIPVATADADVPTTAYTATYASDITDDIAPIYINGTYIGANHGAFVAVLATMTGHGKTVEDVGSEWTDGDGDKFYIMRIVSANQVWLVSENKSATDIWQFVTTVTDNTLTHSSGATHTDGMSFTATAGALLMPGIKGQTRQILANGVSPITADGVTKCRWLDVQHNYTVSDVPALLDYVISQVGSATQPSFTDASIDDCVTMQHTYRYSANGACAVTQTVTTHQTVLVGLISGMQNAGLAVGGATKGFTYAPGLSAVTVGADTYDFTARAETTTVPAAVTFPVANWLAADAPPDRVISYTGTDSATPDPFGWAIGYHTASGAGTAAARVSTLQTDAGQVYTSRKVYPRCVQGLSTTYPTGQVPADTTISVIGYRCPVNYLANSFATNVSWYRVGSGIWLILDVHATVTDQAVALSRELANRTITVVDSTDLTVAESVVGASGITITTENGYGWAVLALQ